MAGTRVEKVGSIFTRVQGLLRSGALAYNERPLWYDVYEAFPPLVEPRYTNRVGTDSSESGPRNIVYREDFIRAQFYGKYGTVGIINLKNNAEKTVCQRFVEICWDLRERDVDPADIFSEAEQTLKREGHVLKTLTEIHEEKVAKLKAAKETNIKKLDTSVSVVEVFGKSALTIEDEEDTSHEPINTSTDRST